MDHHIGLIGDVHAQDELLALVLRELSRQRVGQILCTGDIVDGTGDPDRCCALLLAAGAAAVRGNHERWCLEDQMRSLPQAHRRGALLEPSLRFLGALPATQVFPDHGLLLCHGVGDNDMARLKPDDEGYALQHNDDLRLLLERRDLRFVVAGHTHCRMVRTLQQVTFVNPGSLIPGQDCGFMVLSPVPGRVRIYAGLESGAPTLLEEVEIRQDH